MKNNKLAILITLAFAVMIFFAVSTIKAQALSQIYNPDYPIVNPPVMRVNNCPSLIKNLSRYNVYYGAKNNNVKLMQNFLFNYYGIQKEVVSSGYFGNLTLNYLNKFQSENSLTLSKTVDQTTLNTIKRFCGIVDPVPTPICPAIYQPVCGQVPSHVCCGNTPNKPDYCKYTKVACSYQEKTFGNLCAMNGSGGNFLYNGECNIIKPDGGIPNNCKVWYDGCNTCSRGSVGGAMMCTLMACIQGPNENNPAKCTSYFDGVSPIIKSISGPTTIQASDKGTWKIDASISTNEQLTYKITWGDENRYRLDAAIPSMKIMAQEFIQQTTFEHAYIYPGVYTITVEVQSASGQTTKSTMTVNAVTY
jgi:hypothetical protein